MTVRVNNLGFLGLTFLIFAYQNKNVLLPEIFV